MPNLGVQFFVYENLSNILSQRDMFYPSVCGGISGTIAKLVSFPLDTVKKKIQGHGMFTAVSPENAKCPKIVPTMRNIYGTEGTLGFYKGLVPSLLKSSIQAGLIFTFYENCKRILNEYN